MGIEDSLARKSAFLGPVIEVVEQFQSDRKGALRIMQEFFEGTGGGSLEVGYLRWRAGLSPEFSEIVVECIQGDPEKEKISRGLYFDLALDRLIYTGHVVKKPSIGQ